MVAVLLLSVMLLQALGRLGHRFWGHRAACPLWLSPRLELSKHLHIHLVKDPFLNGTEMQCFLN